MNDIGRVDTKWILMEMIKEMEGGKTQKMMAGVVRFLANKRRRNEAKIDLLQAVKARNDRIRPEFNENQSKKYDLMEYYLQKLIN